MKNNYLYLTKISAWIKSSDNKFEFFRNSDGYFNSLEEAIGYGILYLNNGVFYELAETKDDIPNIIETFENNKNYGYIFEINKICCNHIKFKSEEDVELYYKENIKNISTDDLYDFIMRLCKIEYLYYSHSGRLINAELGDLDFTFCSSRAVDKDNFHCNEFKKGDLVKIKEFGDQEYFIYGIENQDKSIFDSKDPWHFTKGYYLGIPGNIEPINDYDAYRFMDEDLISLGGNIDEI